MKQQIKIWGTRFFIVALLAIGAQHWGLPLYKQYFVPKKAAVHIPTARVEAGRFVVSFHEIGTLEAENSVPVNSVVGGKIISIVEEGKVVAAGDNLVQLDPTDLTREVRDKQLAYENARADVNRAKAELDILKEQNRTKVEQEEAQLEFDRTELERAKEQLKKKSSLADEKLVPRSEVDQAEFDVRSKELTVLKETKSLDLKRKEVQSEEQRKIADVRNVEFRATMAKLNLEDAQRRLKSTTIKAPAGGMVVISKHWTSEGRRKLQEGEEVHPSENVCHLPDLSGMLVRIQVGESDAPRVTIGMPVLIRLEAIPNKVFHGTVKSISSLATEPLPWEAGATPGRKNFEVVVAVEESDPKTLKPGMTGDVEFIRDAISEAIYVPLEAVIEQHGKTCVFVKDGKHYRRTLVKTGKNNDNFICVTKGLKRHQIVTLRDPTRPLEEQEAPATAAGVEEKKPKKRPLTIPSAE